MLLSKPLPYLCHMPAVTLKALPILLRTVCWHTNDLMASDTHSCALELHPVERQSANPRPVNCDWPECATAFPEELQFTDTADSFSPNASSSHLSCQYRHGCTGNAHRVTLMPGFDGHAGSPGLWLLCWQQCSALGQVVLRPDLQAGTQLMQAPSMGKCPALRAAPGKPSIPWCLHQYAEWILCFSPEKAAQ